MESIQNSINNIVLKGRAAQQQRMTSELQTKSLRELSLIAKKATLEQVLMVIGEVELSKQIHLSPEERAVLQADLFSLNETIEQIRKRGESVKRNTTYGKISFDVWYQAETTYTSEELNDIVNSRIRQRQREYEALAGRKLDTEELVMQGLIEAMIWWRQKIADAIQKHAERIDKRCKQLRAQFYHLPDQAKIDLWTKAVAKGLVKDGDRFAFQLLPLLIPQMMQDFEEAVKANKEN